MTSKERKIAGANYIVVLFGDLEDFTWQAASYVNAVVEYGNRYPKDKLEKDQVKIDEVDRVNLNNTIQQMRMSTFRIFVKLSSLGKHVTVDAKLKEAYEKVRNEAVPKSQDVEDFVVKINTIFAESVLPDLLTSSTDIINKFTTESKPQETKK